MIQRLLNGLRDGASRTRILLCFVRHLLGSRQTSASLIIAIGGPEQVSMSLKREKGERKERGMRGKGEGGNRKDRRRRYG